MAPRSTVPGGFENTASGDYATVAGGYFNTASGIVSTVAGGQNNIASGLGSFAAGSSANANGMNGCFVFDDDSTFNDVSCGLPNQFVVRALGGVYFLTAGNTNGTYTCARLAPGATAWTVWSESGCFDSSQGTDGAGFSCGVRIG